MADVDDALQLPFGRYATPPDVAPLPPPTTRPAYDYPVPPESSTQTKPDYMGEIIRSNQRQQQLVEEGMERSDRLEAERREVEGPMRESLMRDLAAPRPRLRTERLQQVPPAPQQNIAGDMRDFLSTAIIIGALGGLVGRAHATNALNAFAGAYEGYRQNRMDDFNARYKEWEAAVEGVKENNNLEIQRYKAIFEDRKLGVEEKQSMLQLAASEFQNRSMYEAARSNDILHAAQVYQQLVGNLARFDQAAQRLDETKRAHDLQEKKFQQQLSGIFTPEQAMARAQRWLAGDDTAFQNLGRGAQGPENIKAIENAIDQLLGERKISQADAVNLRRNLKASAAGLRTTFTQEARIGGAINELRLNIPAAREAVADYWGSYGRSGIGALRWNQAQNLYDLEVQNPKLRTLAVALNAVISPYAVAMSRGGTGAVDMRAEAHKLLSTVDSPETAEAALDMMEREARNAVQAPAMTREQMLRGETPGTQEGEYPEGTIIRNYQTGQRMIMMEGSWTPLED